MARQAKHVDCNEGAKTRLLEIARSRKEQSGLSLRAKIVLQYLEGKQIKETGYKPCTEKNLVHKHRLGICS